MAEKEYVCITQQMQVTPSSEPPRRHHHFSQCLFRVLPLYLMEAVPEAIQSLAVATNLYDESSMSDTSKDLKTFNSYL